MKVELMMVRSNFDSSSLLWEVLVLVAQHLDPKSLAMASCVSKSWYKSMSSDYIWQSKCVTRYPSLSNLKITHPYVSYRRLYAIAYIAAKSRARNPPMPQFSLDNLIFDIHIVCNKKSHPIIKLSKVADEFCYDHNGVFRFDYGANNFECLENHEVLEDVKITWNVVLKDWSAVFTMMDCEGQVKFASGSEAWFSQDLPRRMCCSGDALSGIVADMKLMFCDRRESSGGDKVMVDKVSVGILSMVNWRYVTVDDGIRYLQHFLLPC